MKYLIPFAIGCLLVFLLMRSCNKPLVSDTHVVDSLNKEIAARDSIFVIKKSQWDEDRKRQDSIIIALTKTKEQQYDAMKGQIVSLTFQRNKYRTAFEGRDTTGQLEACAEYIRLGDSLLAKAAAYELTIESLIQAQQMQHGQDSTMIAGLLKDRDAGRQQIVALQRLLSDSIHDNNDLRTALSRTKKGRWLIAGLSALAAGILVNQIK